MHGWVEPATEADAEIIIARGLREQDVQEMGALGQAPDEALLGSFRESAPLAFTIKADEDPVGMFGVAAHPSLRRTGVVWMLASEGLYTIKRDLITQAPGWIEHLNTLYPTLTNVVDERNTVSTRWLERLGFVFVDELIPVGGTNFRRFYRATGIPVP